MQEWSPQQDLRWLQERAFEEAYDARKKRARLAYLLAVLLGCLGAHRLYLERRVTGLLMLALWLSGLMITIPILATVPTLAAALPIALHGGALAGLFVLIPWLWALIDLFLIPAMLRQANADLAERLRERLRAGEPV